jgi:hypothetical protein
MKRSSLHAHAFFDGNQLAWKKLVATLGTVQVPLPMEALAAEPWQDVLGDHRLDLEQQEGPDEYGDRVNAHVAIPGALRSTNTLVNSARCREGVSYAVDRRRNALCADELRIYFQGGFRRSRATTRGA